MSKEESKRIHSLDFLRGGFIMLALFQHFCWFTNFWFTRHFNEEHNIDLVYLPYKDIVGYLLPIDTVNQGILWWGTPWISQIYLTMAAFNLVSRKGEEFNSAFPQKLNIFLILFGFFFFENFLIAQHMGDAYSFYPLLAWMIILTIVGVVYRYFSIKGVIALFIFSQIRFILPLEQWNDNLITWMEINFHPGWDYDAKLDHFLGSGCLGAMLGYMYHHTNWKDLYKYIIPIILGLSMFFIWDIWGADFYIVPESVLETEHLVSESFLGMVGLWGIQLFTIMGFIFAEKKGLKMKLPIINWVGKHSLTVFGIHRVFFVKILMPSAILWTAKFNMVIQNNWIFIWTCVFITVGFSYLVRRSRVHQIIFK